MIQAVVNEQKKEDVKQLVALFEEYPIIGVMNMESLPARNLASMRKQLREQCSMIMKKKRLMRLAIAQSKKPGLEKLEAYMEGMPALLFTKENPFSLFKTIKKNQSPAPIKAGQEAPYDLIVPAGVTEFTPGPMIGELGQMGIKTAVEDGKIAIKQDATIATAGEVVDEKQAGFLTKMGIEPMRIGLKLVAVYEEGEVIEGGVLDIDEEAFMQDLQQAAGEARNLAIELAYTTSDTIETLLAKGYMSASSLAREAGIMTADNVGEILAQATAAGEAISALVPDAPVEEKKEEAAEDKPEAEVAESKEESKPEAPAEETPKEEEKEATETPEAPTTEGEPKEEAAAEPAESSEKAEEVKPEAAEVTEKSEEKPAESAEKKEETPKEEPAAGEAPKEEEVTETPEAPAEKTAESQSTEESPTNDTPEEPDTNKEA